MSKVEKLHTDALESKFGLVAARLVEQDRQRRVIDIVSICDGVSRTHAITWFKYPDGEDLLIREREVVQAGALLGKTIRQAGWQIEKPLVVAGIVELPDWLMSRFKTDTGLARVQMYDFVCSSGSVSQSFGVVCEIVTPELCPIQAQDLDNWGLMVNRANFSWVNRLMTYLYSETR